MYELGRSDACTIGRANDNDVVLVDGLASRYHAHIRWKEGAFRLIDGAEVQGELKRSANHTFVNGQKVTEHRLESGDEIKIGESVLRYLEEAEGEVVPSPGGVPESVRFEDKPLGHTQVLISAHEIMGLRSGIGIGADSVTGEELKLLRAKEQNLQMLYELSKSFSDGFDLKSIFNRATDIIFRGTPADRVVALLADETVDGKILEYSLAPIAVRAREARHEDLASSVGISRTVTQKVMRERVALLSQDAAMDESLRDAASIVSQGVRSTICAPLITESEVHGVIYADRLDPFSSFTSDDLELVTAVAAQMAVMVQTVKVHDRLAREEVARANYSRFMPENVVKELLHNPSSFRLGGVNQKVTVLFADIRGFTSFSEKENPERVVSLLNRYLSAMSEIIFAFGGTLDKFIGDGLMALFGAPSEGPNDAKNALKAAVAMQKRLQQLNLELAKDGFGSVQIGIGLHTGIATVGYIGSDRRSEYTAIGDTVNLAARLEQNAGGGKILVSASTARECAELATLIPCEKLSVKNRAEPVELFEVKWE